MDFMNKNVNTYKINRLLPLLRLLTAQIFLIAPVMLIPLQSANAGGGMTRTLSLGNPPPRKVHKPKPNPTTEMSLHEMRIDLKDIANAGIVIPPLSQNCGACDEPQDHDKDQEVLEKLERYVSIISSSEEQRELNVAELQDVIDSINKAEPDYKQLVKLPGKLRERMAMAKGVNVNSDTLNMVAHQMSDIAKGKEQALQYEREGATCKFYAGKDRREAYRKLMDSNIERKGIDRFLGDTVAKIVTYYKNGDTTKKSDLVIKLRTVLDDEKTAPELQAIMNSKNQDPLVGWLKKQVDNGNTNQLLELDQYEVYDNNIIAAGIGQGGLDAPLPKLFLQNCVFPRMSKAKWEEVQARLQEGKGT